VIVTNRGKGGERAYTGLARFVDSFRADLPEVVIILEGTNDLLSGQGASALAEAEGGVSELASDARNRGARVFVCALTPTKPGRRNIPLSTIFAINERLRVVARGEGAYFIDTFNPLLADLDSNVDSDGLHLTAAGYKRLGEVVFAAIKADLEIQ
jgi:lysophospholipase L1-like esterase